VSEKIPFRFLFKNGQIYWAGFWPTAAFGRAYFFGNDASEYLLTGARSRALVFLELSTKAFQSGSQSFVKKSQNS
jgi:hypothetical protein